MEVKQIKKKLIFTDLDETLLKENKYHYRTLHKFILKLLKNNFIIIPVTSKTYLEVINILKQIKLKIPFSVENGAAYYVPIKNNKDYKYKKILNPYAINRININQILHKNIFKKYFYSVDIIENMSLLKQKKITKLSSYQLESFSSREYTIPVLWNGDKSLKKEFENSLLKYNLKITFGGKLYNISGLHEKFDAMSFFTGQYKQKYRLKKLIVIALGDNQNDIELLNNSNYSGIVKNDNYEILSLKKKNNIFRSFTKAPYGWIEVLVKIMAKMEKDYN